MDWKVLDNGAATAQENMAIDRALLRNLAVDRHPVLRFYEWTRPSITHGYFIDPYKHLKEQTVRDKGIEIAARPTGGGIVLHQTDFAFSILLPNDYPGYSANTLENYALINKKVSEVVKISLGLKESPSLFSCQNCPALSPDFCMASPSPYDVMWNGKKIAGGAQRRTRHGLLHQGTICVNSPEKELLTDLVLDKRIKEAILLQKIGVQIDRAVLKQTLMKIFATANPVWDQ